MVGFRDFISTGHSPVSKKLAVKRVNAIEHSEDRVATLAKIFLSIFSKTPGIFFSKIACIAMIWIFRGLLKFFGHSTKT